MGRSRILTTVAVLVFAGLVAWLIWGRGPETVDPSAALTGTPGTAILIPGHGGNSASLAPMAAALKAAGWSTETADIGDGSGDLAGYGALIRAYAQRARATGAPVALIGYSEGGLIARAAIANGAAPYVTRVATIASPHSGTKVAGLGVFVNSDACDTACQQMAPDSDFLNALPVAGDETRWLSIFTDSDDVVLPPDSGALDGSTTVRLQDVCPTRADSHGQVISDPFVLGAVTSFVTTGIVPTTCS